MYNGIPQLRTKEISIYKSSDLWTEEDDQLFLKWVTNKRDRCYHTMARNHLAAHMDKPISLPMMSTDLMRYKTYRTLCPARHLY